MTAGAQLKSKPDSSCRTIDIIRAFNMNVRTTDRISIETAFTLLNQSIDIARLATRSKARKRARRVANNFNHSATENIEEFCAILRAVLANAGQQH